MGRLPRGQAPSGGDDTREARTGDRFAEEITRTSGGRDEGEPRPRAGRFELGGEPDRRRGPSPVYVSMHDPVGEPAFRPSKTKPIPRWMQYLPSQRQDAGDCADRPSSLLDDYLSPSDSSITDAATEPEARDSPRPPPVPPHTVPVRPAPAATHEVSPASHRGPSPNMTPDASRKDAAFSPFHMSRPFTLITEEPAQRPSSKLGAGRIPPSRHVRFISPPQAPSTASAGRSGRPSESSEFLERYSSRRNDGVGGDGVVEPAYASRPRRIMPFQDQLKRVFGFS